MLRFLFRLAAMVSLSVAVIMTVLDTTRSVAASHVVLTPLATSWLSVSPDTLAAFEAFMREKIHPGVWDGAIAWVLNLPGFVVFDALAFILYAIGYKPSPRRPRRFAAGQ
jgi:hypothetical protein